MGPVCQLYVDSQLHIACTPACSAMPTLAYWKIRGLAQPIRLVLNYAGQEFDDVQYEQGGAPDFSREAWTSVKYTIGLDFPNLPYYIDDDVKITQTNAILSHIGRKHDLVGKTDAEKAMCDVMLGQAMDFRAGFIRIVYNPDYDNLKVNYFKDLPNTLTPYEKRLSDNLWFAGKNLTVADFALYELLDQQRIMQEGVFNDFPKISGFLDRFEALPKIKKYMSSDKFLKTPINNTAAAFK